MREFGVLEAAVMDKVWSAPGAVSVREVVEDLRRDRPIAYTTVMTVMDNLHRKGFLGREQVGRAYLYRPVHSRQEHNAQIMAAALTASEDTAATLFHFLGKIGPPERDRLRAALQIPPASTDR